MYSNTTSVKRRLEYNAEDYPPEKIQKIALYLKDYTPIRTIEVGNIPEDICFGYLRGYFEHAAGAVTNVSIAEKLEEDQVKRVGYVTFLLPEDAARLICDPDLQFNIKFTIKQADSVHQPKIDPKAFKFEDINDDCFFHIISYLSLIDIVNLGKTSTRLQSVTDQVLEKKSHFSFDANTGDSSVNERDLPVILEKIGNYIQSIDWSGLNSFSLPYLGSYCPNVTKLKLRNPSTSVQSYIIKGNKQLFSKVKTLEICSAGMFDITLKSILSYSPKLKSLHLEKCHNLRGRFFYTWKNSKLKNLKIIDSPKVGCEVFDFQGTHRLATFSVDICCSFQQCLSSPAKGLEKLIGLTLDYSCFHDDKLQLVNLKDLKRLTTLTMTRKCTQTVYDCNKIISAMSEVTTLKSLSIENILIDGDTFKCLGLFKNLQHLRLNYAKNTIKNELYSSLSAHLPKLTALSLRLSNSCEEMESKWIGDMISSLNFLDYFSHSSMNWQLLNMILQVQLPRQQSVMKIGVSKVFLDDPRKKSFMFASRGAIQFTVNE